MKIKIHYKITLVIALIFAFALIAIYFFLLPTLQDHALTRIKANLLKETALLKAFFETKRIQASDMQEFDDLADQIDASLDRRVTIIGLDGVVLGDSELGGRDLIEVENHINRPEVQEALEAGFGVSRRFSTTLGIDMLYVARPLLGQGIIRLSVPLTEIQLVASKLKKLLLISFFFAFLLTLIVSFLVSIFVSRPLREMSSIAKNIAMGDFSKRLTVNSKDEIGDLAKSFNHMSEQIKARIEEVLTGKSRLEAVLLSMFEGVMVVDRQGNILLVNQRLKDFLKIKEDTLNLKPLEVIRNIEVQEIVNQALKLQEGVLSKEISLLLESEKILLVHAAAVVIEGKNEGAVLVFHDITELRKLENIRKDFVANVSHELRTPISSIKGFAETLLAGALNDKKNAEDFVKIILSDSDRLARLIDDILDLSKIESGRMSLNLTPCDINDLARKVLSGLTNKAKLKKIKLNVEIPKKLPKAMADETRLSQVMLNLVDNAIKYNKDKGEVIISAREEDEALRIEVKDTGIGIPENDIPRIFERFYRVDKARSRELGGTGLGLSIVKHIVSAHRGEVFVESSPEGTTFSFTIPKC